MKKARNRCYRVLGVAAAALLVAGGTVAVAGAAHKQPNRMQAVEALVLAGVHADVSLVRADGSTNAFSVDRGRVTAASSTSVTLQRRDSKSVTIGLDAGTKLHGTIAVGRPVLVFSRGGVAFRVRAPGPFTPPSAPATPAAKKAEVVHVDTSIVRVDGTTVKVTLDRGQVTASSSTSLTLKRGDGKSVTFSVNAQIRVRGMLKVGGKALVFSREGAAFRILARAAA